MNNRREFLKTGAISSATAMLTAAQAAGTTTQPQPQGFYSVDKRHGRWWLITPRGEHEFSRGLNHIDPASLRYPENVDVWRDKYGNSMRRWLQESVAPDLQAWGLNCVGWNQEVVTRGLTNHRHSRAFIFEEYYEAKAPLPVEVVNAAMPFIDVLSFQHFGLPEKVKQDFQHWHELTDMPILLADGAGSRKLPDGTLGQNGPQYAATLEVLRSNPSCVGFHLCGAYIANRVRRRGLRNEREQLDEEAVQSIVSANQLSAQWVSSFN